MSTVAFIGLGIMGEPMARNLLKGGHIVRAFDVRTSAMEAISSKGAVPVSYTHLTLPTILLV